MKPLSLCYHAVSETWNHELSVSPEAFEEQLQLLLRRGYRPVGAAEAAAGDRQAPPRHLRRRVHECPQRAAGARAHRCQGDRVRVHGLRRRRPAARFARAAGRARRAARGARDDDVGRAPRARRSAASRSARTRSRTDTCPRSRTPSSPTSWRSSRERLEDELGRPCTVLAYPFGDCDERVRVAARVAGYEIAFGLPGDATGRDPFDVFRVGVWGGDSARKVAFKANSLVRSAAGDAPTSRARFDSRGRATAHGHRSRPRGSGRGRASASSRSRR